MTPSTNGQKRWPADRTHRADLHADETGAFRDLFTQLIALGDYAEHAAVAKLDLAGLRVRGVLIRLLVSAVWLLLTVTMTIVCAVFLIRGMAGGLAAAVGSPWLGQVLTGLVGFGVLGAMTAVVVHRSRTRRVKRKVAKYEKRKATQRAAFGRDVEQAARRAH